MDERRKTQRFQIKAPLTISLGDREIAGFTRDLSNKGVYFYLGAGEIPRPGQEFEFVVALPPEITLSSFNASTVLNSGDERPTAVAT